MSEKVRQKKLLYIVAAMEDELVGLRRELDALGASQGVGFPLEFHLTGIGPQTSAQMMSAAIVNGRRRPQGALMLGVAGALETGRETGELILSDNYLLDSSSLHPEPVEGRVEAIAPDPTLLEVAEAAAIEARMPVTRGNSLTVDHLISEEWERRQLREKYGAASVNMEDHAVATAAQEEGVPFLSVRVVLDTAEQRLPGYLPKFSKGRSALFTEVMARPWRIPTLLRLKSQMELCQSVLTRFGLSFIEQEAERRRNAREAEAADAIY